MDVCSQEKEIIDFSLLRWNIDLSPPPITA